jgi:hypothetical protein
MWQQGLDPHMTMLIQQEIERQRAPPPFFPPAAAPLQREHVSSMVQDWQMKRMLQQELERQWTQPSAQFVTPEMIETADLLSRDAAHQAAVAWQQEQESIALAWQQSMAWQQTAVRAPAPHDPRASGMFPAVQHDQGLSVASPLLPPPLGLDAGLQLPHHALSGLQPHLAPPLVGGQNLYSGMGVPQAAVPLQGGHPYMHSAMHPQKPTRVEESIGHQGGAPRNGTTKANGLAPKKSGRNGVPPGSGNGPAPQRTPKALSSGFDKSLRANLETLQGMDCNCIVQVRKINRLGFESAQALEVHFSAYGKVDRVLVSHCYASQEPQISPFRVGLRGHESC